jgi:hypothetical protein
VCTFHSTSFAFGQVRFLIVRLIGIDERREIEGGGPSLALMRVGSPCYIGDGVGALVYDRWLG